MNDNDDIPIFRPRLGAGRAQAPKSPNTFRRAVLNRVHGQIARRDTRRPTRGRTAVPGLSSLSRRVVVKAHIVRMTRYGQRAAALHLRYIVRDGVEKDGAKGRLYGSCGPAEVTDFEAPRPGERHQFRLIVSPEDGADLDLTTFARRFMARIERDVGRPLEWAAVNHFNTDNPHIHVVIRGVDRRGEVLRLDRAYVSHGLRATAQVLATEELGPRRPRDVERQRLRELTQNRMTSLDRALAHRASGQRIEIPARGEGGRGRTAWEALLVRRLEHLQHLELATRVAPGTWSLDPGWQEKLKALGLRGDIIKEMHQALQGDPARYRILRAEAGDGRAARSPVHGRVVAKGMADELKGTFFAVVESPTGGGYHVPLDHHAAAAVQVGDLVTVRWAERGRLSDEDRRTLAWAKRNGMVYAPAAEAQELHDRRSVEAGVAEAAGRRRARALERLGLAADLGDGRWRLDARAFESLEAARGPGAGRFVVHRDGLRLEDQVTYPGPVRLDRLSVHGLAPTGFGAELRSALERRSAFLRRIGIDPASSGRIDVLRERERAMLGRHLEQAAGLQFLETPPRDFRGRVVLLERRPSGLQYAQLEDGVRFTLVPATGLVRRMEGRAMTVAEAMRGRAPGWARERGGV